MKINFGTIENEVYKKRIDYNKAVIWKFRQISVHQKVKEAFDQGKFHTIQFIDELHNKVYTVEAKKAFNHAELKKVGQEEQWYFTIAILKEAPLKPQE